MTWLFLFFLLTYQIPEDILTEAGVCLLCDELSAHQQEFIELHKESERNKNDSRCDCLIANRALNHFQTWEGACLRDCKLNRDPQKLKLNINQREEEKTKLQKLIKKAVAKADCTKNAELYSSCTSLRKQQEEKIYLEGQVTTVHILLTTLSK